MKPWRTYVAEPPLDPSGEEGRRLLREELEKLPYQERRSILDVISEWLTDRLAGATGPSAGLFSQVVMLALVAALTALVIYAVTRIRVSNRRRGSATDDDIVVDRTIPSEEYRRRAREAEARGDHSAALLDWFRALVRSGDERALLGDSPGRTAHELVGLLSRRFPDEATTLRQAGLSFDDVRYGGRSATPAQSSGMRELDARLAKARPQHDDTTDGDQLVAPGRWAP